MILSNDFITSTTKVLLSLVWPSIICGIAAVIAAFAADSKKSLLPRSLGLMFMGPSAMLLWIILLQGKAIGKMDWISVVHMILAAAGLAFALIVALRQARRKWSWFLLVCGVAVVVLIFDCYFVGGMVLTGSFL